MNATTATRKPTATLTEARDGVEHTYTAVRADGGTTRRYGSTYDVFVDGEKVCTVVWRGGRRYEVRDLGADVRDSWEFITGDGGAVSDVMAYVARCSIDDAAARAARPVLTVVADAPVELPLVERIQAMRGKGAKTSPADLTQGQVVRVDGTKYLVHAADRSEVTGSIMVEVLTEDGEWDVLSLGSTVLVPVLGSLA